MNSPAKAIAWQIWRPNRWLFAAELVYFLLVAAVSLVLPAIVGSTPLGAAVVPAALPYLCYPLVLIVTHWLGAFALASADGKHFGFPSHMYVLPVPTRSVVLWPVVFGCAAFACAWWFIACLILRPLGIAAPLWWPAAALVALLTMLQALSWTPFAQNWLRLVLTGPVLALLAGILMLAIVEVPEVVVAGLLLALAALSVAVSVWTVSHARHGGAIDVQLPVRALKWAADRRFASPRPFKSAAAAQLWLEWQGHGWVLPALVLVVIIWPLPALLAKAGDVAFYWRMLGAILALPPLMAVVAGSILGKQDAWSKFEMTSFVATRPMTTAAMVRAKLVMAALSTAAVWLVVLPVVGLLLLESRFFASVREVANAAGVARGLAAALTILATAVVATWLLMAQNLWLGLMGREWLVTVLMVLIVATLLCGGAIGFWIYFYPAWYSAVQAAVPWMLAGLLLIKATVAAIVVAALDRSRLMKRSSIAAMAGAWALVAAGLCLAAYRFVPGEHLPLGTAAGVIALWLPFSRLAGAPLALAWNRHR